MDHKAIVALEAIFGLDMAVVNSHLERKGWPDQRRGHAIREYRRFLAMIALHPGETIVPSHRDADESWHGHLLDTAIYQADCQRLFGRFIHHRPAMDPDQGEMAVARLKTFELYLRCFGETAPGDWTVEQKPAIVTDGDEVPCSSE
jgi:hypothetical protein